MFRLIIVCLFPICVVAIGCSSSNPEPTEEGLIQRTKMANDALNTQDWAGIYQKTGELLPAGSYYYVVKVLETGKVKKGWLYLTY